MWNLSFLVDFHLKYGLARKFYKFFLGNCGGNLSALIHVSVFVTLQHSLPYSRTDFTLLLYNLIFVFGLYCLDFQMGRNLCNADLALASLFLMSFCVGCSVLTTVPRYVNLSTCWITVPSASSLKFNVVFSRISWVFLHWVLVQFGLQNDWADLSFPACDLVLMRGELYHRQSQGLLAL